jgi:nitroimidazol reductase NimA-like FMN-containing flavoprotein (pyridoxamine 5'-phosphate oxidase superfamily)
VAIYVHGAAEGLKHDLISHDNRVCVEADIFHRFVSYGEGDAASVTTEFESVVGFGTAEIISGAEAERAMELMLAHCGYPGFKYNKAMLNITRIYKFALTSVTGKKRFL